MLVEAVEHGQIALAGDTETGVDPLLDEGLDQEMPGKALARLRGARLRGGGKRHEENLAVSHAREGV